MTTICILVHVQFDNNIFLLFWRFSPHDKKGLLMERDIRCLCISLSLCLSSSFCSLLCNSGSILSCTCLIICSCFQTISLLLFPVNSTCLSLLLPSKPFSFL